MSTFFVCTPEAFLAAEPVERRKLVMAQIDLTPELHDQSDWARKTNCGTVCCTAGWAVTLAGYRFMWSEQVAANPSYVDPDVAAHVMVDGARKPIEDVARKLLDLTEWQADSLFYEAEDAEDIRELMEEIA